MWNLPEPRFLHPLNVLQLSRRWENNVAVLEVEFCRFECGHGSVDLRLIHVDGVLLSVIVLLRNGALADDFLVACELDLCEIECRLSLRQGCLCRVELRFVGPRINDKQKL